jgi:predicted Zn-dependent peptidase
LLKSLILSLTALSPAPQEPVGPPVDAGAGVGPLAFVEVAGGGRYRTDSVDAGGRTSIWLCALVGSDHDPIGSSGLARVFGELLRAGSPAPSRELPAEVVVTERAVLVGAVAANETSRAEAVARCAGWLRGELALTDDEILAARGRALLRADDEAAVLPGPMLRERAERILFPGSPAARRAAGEPEEIRALTPTAIREAFARAFHPSRAILVGTGQVEGLERAFGTSLATDRAPAPWPPVSPRREGGGADSASTETDRVAAPFVCRAIVAPRWGEEGYLPFLIAMEVARSRAASTFRTLRGGEIEAEFPPLAYDFLRAPRAAFVGRRGRDGDDVGSVRAELDSLAAGLRDGGATAPEIQGALSVLMTTLDVPPLRGEMSAALERFPGLVLQRGYVTCCYGVHGWPADLPESVGQVPLGHVDRALARFFAKDAGGCEVVLRPGS